MKAAVGLGVAAALAAATVLVVVPVLSVLLLAAGGGEDTLCSDHTAHHAVADAAARDDGVGTEFETLNAEQLANAQTILDVGAQVGVGEFGLVVAIATAMQESKLINLDHGDRDSLGLFQQRPSTGWGTPVQLRDPVFAARAFFGGDSSPHWRAPTGRAEPPGLRDIVGYESMTVAQAAQAVQRSAYPDAYAQWEQMARITVAALAGDGDGEPVICGPGDAMTCPATGMEVEAGLTPDALRVLRCLHDQFPDIHRLAGTGERPSNPDSDHPAGRAVDVLFNPSMPAGTHRLDGDRIATWLVEHATELGVKYVIWWEKIWSADRADEGWRPYEHPSGRDDDTSAHRDHLHVSVYGDSAGTGDGAWVVPVQGEYRITAGFGQCGTYWSACHTGVDMAAAGARPIVAAAAGTVTTIADLGGESYGQYVTLTHADGTETWYGHLQATAPSLVEDEHVRAGQLIGYMGATGNATGRHLHFEVRPGAGAPVDPVPWMRAHGAVL